MAIFQKLSFIFKNKFTLYLLFTWVPCILISMIPTDYQSRDIERQAKSKAQEYANFHVSNLDQFLGETIGRLEMLATSISVQNNDLPDVDKILHETMGKDPRLSGFFWASPDGEILISTNTSSSLVNVGDRAYFQEALKTERTSISEPHIGRVSGRYIISIATPIMIHGQVKGVLVASLRMNEIKATIKHLIHDETITIIDQTGKVIMTTDSIPKKNAVQANMTVSKVPWTITAYTKTNIQNEYGQTYLKYLALFLTITHILFLLMNYALLRKRLKLEKAQTELHKLELIGRLAASTAHEIRNPLTGIKGLIKLLSEEYEDPKSQSYFNVIQSEIDRINTIVSELLVLGKPTAYHLKTHNVNEIVAEIEPIIKSEANFMNIELSMKYSLDDLPVSCVKDQLKQVVLNLTKNSLQAMPFGGKLSISLERQSTYCFLKVEDNGEGMTQEQIRQAFNPFYTLKKDGSGLGLTVCKRIIESYNGEIFIKSSSNQGTSVEILLPLKMDKKTA